MIGSTVSHYRILRELGTGGMGIVYEAQDERLPRRVALKFLPEELASDAEAARRFKREADHIALLNHPHICTIYEVDSLDGRLFIVMERLQGTPLKARLAKGRLALTELLEIAIQITEALAAAHAKGIVHRDIKPANVFIDRDGGVKVLDFGLARRFSASDYPDALPDGSTVPGRPVGTPNYMAPERIRQGPADPRADLFSLGVMIYQMATERLPFGAATTAETVAKILDDDPVPLTRLSPEHPAFLGQVVAKLLAKEPADRYQSAVALQADLRLLRSKAGRPFSTTRVLAALGIAVLLALLLVTWRC